jgi:hypothetical protein
MRRRAAAGRHLRTAATAAEGGLTASARREARLAGIRDPATVSLESIDRRRRQLWAVAFVVMATLAVAITLLGTERTDAGEFARLPGVRYGQPLMIMALVAYLVEKEAHLRRLSLLLIRERIEHEREQARLAELLEVDRINTAMASDVEYVVSRSLGAAIERLRALPRPSGFSPRHSQLESIEAQLQMTREKVEQIVTDHRSTLDRLLRSAPSSLSPDVPA